MKKYTSSTSLIKTVFIVLLTAWFSSPATAQTLESKRFTLDRENFVDTVKIKIWDGAIVVPVEIAGKTRNLMFDTGAQTAFWIGAEEDWMMPSGDSLLVRDSQNQSQKKALIKFPSIKMGNTIIENYPMIVDEGMGGWTCGEIDGGLGCDLVAKGLSFKFDTKDSLMIVTDRKGFFAKEERGRPMLKFKEKNRPRVFVKFPFGRIKLLFDSGYVGGWIDLPQYLLNRWSKDDKKMRQGLERVTVQVDTTIITAAGLFGTTHQTVEDKLLHIPETDMGGLILKDLWVSTGVNGEKIGAAMLKQVSLIIDAHKKRLVFLPHDGSSEVVVGNKDKECFALTSAEEGDTLGAIKTVVRKGSKEYQQGLRTGDYLISADGVHIPDICTYKMLRRQGKLNRLVFRSPEGIEKKIDR